MPEVEHFDKTLVFAHSVIDQNGAVQQFAYGRAFSQSVAHAWKASEQVYVVE
jgi:hypothetical protein